MRFFQSMIPQNPQLSVAEAEGDLPDRLCLDLKSEYALQRQRRFTFLVGGPAIVLAGLDLQKKRPVFGTFILGLGIACTAWHYTSYKKVADITGIE
tara:strand:+ start:304 stop:591 length:288 start_codon:yes stop_codon:yes gene_type:complete